MLSQYSIEDLLDTLKYIHVNRYYRDKNYRRGKSLREESYRAFHTRVVADYDAKLVTLEQKLHEITNSDKNLLHMHMKIKFSTNGRFGQEQYDKFVADYYKKVG